MCLGKHQALNLSVREKLTVFGKAQMKHFIQRIAATVQRWIHQQESEKI